MQSPPHFLGSQSKIEALVIGNFGERSMSIDPLLNTPYLVQLHAIPAIAAFVLGAAQFLGSQGTVSHRALGWIWVVLMALVAFSSFGIHTICTFGSFSLIHLLSLITIVALPVAVWRAQAPNQSASEKHAASLFGRIGHCGCIYLLPWPNHA
jgi:uncharacterized membrane protein